MKLANGSRWAAALIIALFLIVSASVALAAPAYVIRDDVTGDDATGGDCTLIGTWDSVIKTCTLATDVHAPGDAIAIEGDGIILDGAGHIVTGPPGSTGVAVNGRVGAYVENLVLMGQTTGVLISNSVSCFIDRTDVMNTVAGLVALNSYNTSILNSTVHGSPISEYGVILNSSDWSGISNTEIYGTGTGIYIEDVESGALYKNWIHDNIDGIHLGATANTIVENNTIESNSLGVLEGNYADFNRFTLNRFKLNSTQAASHNGWFEYNHWTDFDSPADGCNDVNGDDICDSPYYFQHQNLDEFPLTDTDEDGTIDILDICPGDATNDGDMDGYCSGSGYDSLILLGDNDNCPNFYNPLQLPGDCLDYDGDGLLNADDPCPNDATNDGDFDGFCAGSGFNPAILNSLTGDNDCNSNDASINPGALEIAYNGIDENCNGLADDDDVDADGYLLVNDCNDNDASINPGALEIAYNGIDENCNGMTDDDDLDSDGYLLAEDCNDNDALINPGALEITYNGIDENCNGMADDDDLDSDCYLLAEDCNDNDALINPGAVEIPYNGIDENCNGMADDDDLDSDGYLLAQDCNDSDPLINPGAVEITYNGIDENCNGMADDDDLDTDGYLLAEDCNDSDASINPGAPEIKFDGIDQNCNGYDLTITVTKADYVPAGKNKPDSLTVQATSSLGDGASLVLDGHGPMTYRGGKWTIKVSDIGGDPGSITVSGTEGSETVPTN